MALNIKNETVEDLVTQAALMLHASKTEAIRAAVAELKERLVLRQAMPDRTATLTRFLEREVWPVIPPDLLGRGISKEEQESILDFEGHEYP